MCTQKTLSLYTSSRKNKTMKVKNITYVLIVCGLLLAISCKTPIGLSEYTNMAAMYNPGTTSLHPEFTVYHHTDTSSQLYIKVNPKELLFNKAEESNVMVAKFNVFYAVVSDDETRQLIDSGSVSMNVNRRSSAQEIITYLTFKAPTGQKYTISIKTTDILREESTSNILYIDKENKFHQQNFLIRSKITKKPFFNNYINCEDTILIETKNKEHNKVKIKYYGSEFKLAPPPFVNIKTDTTFEIKPDSVWLFDFDESFQYKQKYEGVYYYQFDEENSDYGFSLVTFDQYFPDMKLAKQLIPPLQYITTSEEFKAIKENENPKIAVDDFWLGIAGSIEKGKDMIRIYYSRIFFANIYFTSHTYGWRTDRGMIYTVLGPPNVVTRTSNTERWAYNDRSSFKPIYFEFIKTNNNLSENNYILKRSNHYNDYWQRAVATWRRGKIFYLGN